MLNIRKGVFETNSSSCHSIVIGQDIDQTEKVLSGHRGRIVGTSKMFGAILVYDDLEFGAWDVEVLTSWIDKLGYAIATYAYVSAFGLQGVLEDATEMVNRNGYEIDHIEIKGMKQIDGEEIEPYDVIGVDHQSQNLLSDFLFGEDIGIEEFVFDPKYILVISSDGVAYSKIINSASNTRKSFVPVKLVTPWSSHIVKEMQSDENF